MDFNYRNLLELLLKLGPKLPQAWESIQVIIEEVQNLRLLFANGAMPPAFALPLDGETIELEDKVVAAFAGVPAGAFGAPEFPRLREVFQYIKAHPELLKLLLTLLAL